MESPSEYPELDRYREMKWSLPEDGVMSTEERRSYWRDLYIQGGHQDRLFGMTSDRNVQRLVISSLDTTTPQRVLVPGCGVAVDLQRMLIEKLHQGSTVVCADFVPEAVAMAEESFSHPRLTYQCCNTSVVSQLGEFDASHARSEAHSSDATPRNR